MKINHQRENRVKSPCFVMQSNLSELNTFGNDEFIQFRQMLGLYTYKLHRHLVDETIKAVWFRQVFGLLRVQ